MKLSVSLTDEDVAAIDAYARATGLKSRSAAVQQAVRALRLSGLEDDYARAWDEWDASGERRLWEGTTQDGLA